MPSGAVPAKPLIAFAFVDMSEATVVFVVLVTLVVVAVRFATAVLGSEMPFL